MTISESSAPVAELAAAPPEPKRTVATAPKWEQDTRARLRAALKSHIKHVKGLLERDANESDTRIVVTEILVDAFGFDRYDDLGGEYAVKGEYADFVLKIDGHGVAFVEVKRANATLSARHLKQVESYALHDGIEWIILTNGHTWQLWHVEAALPVDTIKLKEIDLLGDAKPAQQIDQLFLFTKEAMRHNQLDSLWKSQRATSPKALGHAILSEPVVRAVRAQLRKTTGHTATMDDIARLLRDTVLKAEACAQDVNS